MKKLFYIGAMSALLLTACGVEKAEVTDNAQEESAKAKEKESEQAKEEEKKAKQEAKEAEKIAKQKEYFVKNTQPAIEEWTKSYDQLWEKLWKPTFEAIGNGSTDVYAAYDNMKALKEGYRELSVKKSVPVEGLSKEQKKDVKEAMSQLNYAAASRQMAAEKAMEMFDKGNFAPSQMDKIKSDITASDSQILKGIAGITTLKQELGLIEDVKK
ncbi:hypothetical protein AMS59_22925 [Lysinibacillus sp. FJAT-14745]|uniref:hypothetical protein n=1 Tax=Lysinibacillus sp. FJAT-14745 TaxID=1704289 RepID=UPI0006AB949E|nr:hypothetical protein [Lysinibacillus sp. FJAT-14745]KOP69763.1 hypothetical protein AMS59_22925 [Lysinibacillus sp. FJAT-14745]